MLLVNRGPRSCKGCEAHRLIFTNISLNRAVTVSDYTTKVFRGDLSVHTCGASSPLPSWGRFAGRFAGRAPQAPLKEPSTAATQVYAIGDLHGDVEAAMACFALCPCIDVEHPTPASWTVKWAARGTPENSHMVVQCGDILDRKRPGRGYDADAHQHSGADEEMILFACHVLHLQAKGHGTGRFIRLLGNHEVMTVQGDVRYATRAALAYYSSCCGGRKFYYAPGNQGALNLCEFGARAIVQIGNVVFMHAGIGHLANVILNRAESKSEPEGSTRPSLAERVNSLVHALFTGRDTGTNATLALLQMYMWDRTQGGAGGDDLLKVCDELRLALDAFVDVEQNVNDRVPRSLVVGHCASPGILSVCPNGQGTSNQVYRIDVAMSRGFDSRTASCAELCDKRRLPQILHIRDPIGVDHRHEILVGPCLPRDKCKLPLHTPIARPPPTTSRTNVGASANAKANAKPRARAQVAPPLPVTRAWAQLSRSGLGRPASTPLVQGGAPPSHLVSMLLVHEHVPSRHELRLSITRCASNSGGAPRPSDQMLDPSECRYAPALHARRVPPLAPRVPDIHAEGGGPSSVDEPARGGTTRGGGGRCLHGAWRGRRLRPPRLHLDHRHRAVTHSSLAFRMFQWEAN
jgi:hypothetical protein